MIKNQQNKNQDNPEITKISGSDNVPELRFPEFKNEGEWKEKKLGEIGEVLMCKRVFAEETNPNDGIPFFKIGTFGRVPDAFISIEKYNEFKNKYSFPNVGEILISASGTIGRLVIYDGSPAYFQDSNIVWLGNNEEIVFNSFLFYCYSNLKWQTSDGGVISRLYNSDLKRMKIRIPKNKIEQQKIASCLSSLDDLITAHSQKLELLKDHKKGLMQHLFPQDGEKLPKLRFKEFEKDGEWVEKKLGEVADFINEKISAENLAIDSYISTENLLPDYAGITIKSKIPSTGNLTKFQEQDILVSNIRPYLKKVWYSNKEGGCSNDVFVIRGKSGIAKLFLAFLLRNDDFISYVMVGAKGVKMPRGDKDLISKYPISYPKKPKEQQKIASCLSSLDALINAQAEKIEHLKMHKKGLMQGLFPKVKG